MKRVADRKLEDGTLERADFGFREQAIAMSEPDQPVEATFRLRVVRDRKRLRAGPPPTYRCHIESDLGRAAGGKR